MSLDANSQLDRILGTIKGSRSLLQLGYNWDGEESLGYMESTWNRARDFILKNVFQLLKDTGRCIDTPDIGPGPDGSIDIHWKLKDCELLVNIPADMDKLAEYYGDKYNHRVVIKGSIDTSAKNQALLMWLTE